MGLAEQSSTTGRVPSRLVWNRRATCPLRPVPWCIASEQYHRGTERVLSAVRARTRAYAGDGKSHHRADLRSSSLVPPPLCKLAHPPACQPYVPIPSLPLPSPANPLRAPQVNVQVQCRAPTPTLSTFSSLTRSDRSTGDDLLRLLRRHRPCAQENRRSVPSPLPTDCSRSRSKLTIMRCRRQFVRYLVGETGGHRRVE